MAAAGISIRPNRKIPQRWSATIPESSPGAMNATSVDIALKPDIRDVFEHAELVDGVMVAGLHLLLVDKIKTASTRSDGKGGKIVNDMNDIFFCLSEMEHRNAAYVPDKLKATLTPDIWENFWARAKVEGDIATYEDWLRNYAGLSINVAIPRIITSTREVRFRRHRQQWRTQVAVVVHASIVSSRLPAWSVMLHPKSCDHAARVEAGVLKTAR